MTTPPRPRRALSLLLAFFAAASALVAEPNSAAGAAAVADEAGSRATPGSVLRGLDEGAGGASAARAPSLLAASSGECRRCLKTCLGAKIQNAQVSFMKVQAPLSLVTWYLFRNRPFSMIPLDKALGKLFGVSPAAYGAVGAAAYLSCKPVSYTHLTLPTICSV